MNATAFIYPLSLLEFHQIPSSQSWRFKKFSNFLWFSMSLSHCGQLFLASSAVDFCILCSLQYPLSELAVLDLLQWLVQRSLLWRLVGVALEAHCWRRNLFCLRSLRKFFLFSDLCIRSWAAQVRVAHASCMPHVCLLYGSCMAHVWLMYGSCMAHVCLMYASCMPMSLLSRSVWLYPTSAGSSSLGVVDWLPYVFIIIVLFFSHFGLSADAAGPFI